MNHFKIALIADNIRSSHNVGSLLRTSDGLAAEIYLTGHTPYPALPNDPRLPHIVKRISSSISKTALGAERSATWHQADDALKIIDELQKSGFLIAALEQTPEAQPLPQFKCRQDIAVIVGSEATGIRPELLQVSQLRLVIPMLGRKESYNVSVAAAMLLYHLRFRA